MKTRNERGVAIVLALTILAILVGMAAYFSMNIGMELRASKGYTAGVKAEALAEAGLAHTIARIRADVKNIRMFDPDLKNVSAFPDLVHRRYSTRAIPEEGVWGDAVDDDGDSDTEDDSDELFTVDDKSTPADVTDDDGFYVIVRDENALVNINALGPKDRGMLAQFPTIRADSLDPIDERVKDGSIADRIVSSRAALPGGRYVSTEQLRSVLGKDDFERVWPEMEHYVSLESSDAIVSGGLVARYFGLDTSGNSPRVNYNDPKGTVIDRGANTGKRLFGEKVFSFSSVADFASTPSGASPLLPGFNPAQPFAVVWTGYVFIPNTTEITFLISYRGGVRMRIADTVLADHVSHWNPGNSGEIIVSDSLPTGWQPVLIEYYSNTVNPAINIHWDGGYHYIDPNTGNNVDDDPDIDLRPDNARMPMASFGFKAGGIYKIASTGVVRDKEGNVAAERTRTASVRLWDYIHESTIEDFAHADAARSHVTFEDSCPTHPIGDSHNWDPSNPGERTWEWEFDPASGIREYDTMYNTIKLGYWENFDDVDTPNPADYPFVDSYSSREAWVMRSAKNSDVLDAESDGDREFVLADNTDPDTGEEPVYADLVGEGATHLAPLSAYLFDNFWYRFEENDNRGPLDRDNYEDKSQLPNSTSDYNGNSHDATPDPSDVDPEDFNGNKIVDGPQSDWVGHGFARSGSNDDYFAMTQKGPKPEDYPFFASALEEFQSSISGTALGAEVQNIGYTRKKIYIAGFHDDGFFYYARKPGLNSDQGFPFLQYRPGVTGEKSVGFYSKGNEAARPRHIDNVRIIPLLPSTGTFTSAPLDVTDVESWGTVAYSAYEDPTGSHVNVALGPEGSASQIPVSDGAAVSGLPTGTSRIQYQATLSMDLKNAAGLADLNYNPPVFADITVTYAVTPKITYRREE